MTLTRRMEEMALSFKPRAHTAAKVMTEMESIANTTAAAVAAFMKQNTTKPTRSGTS
jgi:hypothetical protein